MFLGFFNSAEDETFYEIVIEKYVWVIFKSSLINLLTLTGNLESLNFKLSLTFLFYSHIDSLVKKIAGLITAGTLEGFSKQIKIQNLTEYKY